MGEPIIAIDLGTTNSCISIAAELEGAFTVDGLAGISIITDELNRKFTPSVLAYNYKAKPPKSPFIIGHAAKQRFTDYPPVMFAKRHMGTNKRFQLTDDKDISPEEVSAEILRYLKNIAEEKLARPVSRAVVTVPAYFGIEQKQLTAEAMNRAGFITDLQNSIIIEPVAAAFAYAATCAEENLKILVYDLGGGTFDATILEKIGPNIEVSAFGGDHALGGYNFDLLLADHILSELQKDGYTLDLDTETNQQDRVRYSKLLLEAERAKIEISQPSVKEVFMRHSAIFEDQEGEPVDLDMRLDRQTFEDLISPLVERTMEECQTVLEKSGLQVEDLDAIVMVGGSSFIPMIQRRIKELFGRSPELFEPDLCVALGAALYAATLGAITQDKVVLTLQPLPNKTSFPVIAMCGKVTRLDGSPPAKGYEIEVRDAAGAVYLKQPLDADGGYLLDVDLEKNAENQLFISVLNPQAETEAATTATIYHSDQAPDTEVEGVRQTEIITLPQSIYIQRQSGLVMLAEEGVELPFERIEEFEIGVECALSENGTYALQVELLEGDLTIGVITVDEIPGNIEDGAKVEVKLIIDQDRRIIASVYIPSLNREGLASFNTSKVEILAVSELKRMLDDLAAEWHTLKLILQPEQRAKFGPKIDRMFERTDQFLKVTDPDTSELTRVVRQIRNKMAPLVPQEMDPVMEVFNALCRDVSELIKRAEKNSAEIREHNFSRTLEVLRSQALNAFDNLNQELWHGCYLQIQQLGQRIESMTGAPPELPPPAVLIVMLEELLRDIVKKARELPDDDPRKIPALTELGEISGEIKKIAEHTDENQKQHELVFLYLNRIVSVREELVKKRPGSLVLKAGGDRTEDRKYIRKSAGTPFMPCANVDLLHFSVTTLPVMKPGAIFELNVWGHLEKQKQEVIRRAKEEAMVSNLKIKTKGPVKVSRGTILKVSVFIKDLIVEPTLDIIMWEGEIGNATFVVKVPRDARLGFREGTASIRIGRLLIARIMFVIEIRMEETQKQALDIKERRVKKAFASYSSVDRAKVAGRIQGIQKGAPDIDIFFDVASLRSGDHWKEIIRKEVASSDVLYLFWSWAASKSVHVDWEWRCALEKNGIDGIDPVPLVSPSEVPPPKELVSQLHFNDWILAYEDN